MLQKPYHISISNLLDFITEIASILAILVICEPIYRIYLSLRGRGVGCCWALIKLFCLWDGRLFEEIRYLYEFIYTLATRFLARSRAAGQSAGVNNLKG